MTPANPAAKTVAVEGSRNTRASLVGASAHRDDLKVPMGGRSAWGGVRLMAAVSA